MKTQKIDNTKVSEKIVNIFVHLYTIYILKVKIIEILELVLDNLLREGGGTLLVYVLPKVPTTAPFCLNPIIFPFQLDPIVAMLIVKCLVEDMRQDIE